MPRLVKRDDYKTQLKILLETAKKINDSFRKQEHNEKRKICCSKIENKLEECEVLLEMLNK